MPIAFHCEVCERKFSVKEELAGRRIKCPDCSTFLIVPDPEVRPISKRARDDDEELPTRKSKGKRPKRQEASNTGLIVGLSAGGLAVLVLGIVGVIMLIPKAKPEPVNPPDVPIGPRPLTFNPNTQNDPSVAVGTGQAKPEVFKKLINSCAWIVTSDSVGSGSLVDRNEQLVLTNFHVAGKESTVTVWFPAFDPRTKELITSPGSYVKNRGTAIQGRTVYKDSKRDLALVKLAYVPPGAVTVPLLAHSAKVGENVHSIGSSGALEGALWRYTHGAVRQLYEKEIRFPDQLVHCWMIETNAPTNHGDSGGPIVNDKGQLVAIVQGGVMAKEEDQQRLVSYNVDVREIHYILDQYYKGMGKRYVMPKLSDIDPTDQAAISKKLADSDAGVRLQAVKAIGEFGPEGGSLIPMLVECLKDSDATVKQQAALSLEQIGAPKPDMAAKLLDLADSTEPAQRRYIAKVVGTPNLFKREDALKALLKLCKDDDVETRRNAVPSLRWIAIINRQLAAAAMIERLADMDTEVRVAAIALLGQLGPPVRATALPKLIEVLGDSDESVAQAGSNAIRLLGDATEADLPLLMKTLQSQKPIERAVAMELLARLGPKAKDALPQLQAYLKEGEMRQRLAALTLTGALGKEAKAMAAQLGDLLAEPIKAESQADTAGPDAKVGDTRMREILLRSTCMVMWSGAEGGKQVVKIPESAFVVHVGEKLVLSPYSSVEGHKDVVAFFPVKRGGNLIVQAREYLAYLNTVAIPGQVVATNPKANLALIKLQRLPAGVEALPLAAKAPDKGTKIAALAADHIDVSTLTGILWQLHAGQVIDVMPLKSGGVEGFFVVMNGTLSEFDTGYPIVDLQGNVVAVALETYELLSPDKKKKARVTIGVDVREVRPLLDDYFAKIGGSFREAASQASLGNRTQNNFRILVAKTLAQLGPDAAPAVKALQAALKDTSAGVRAQSALALGAIGKDAKDAIPDMLEAAILEDNPDAIETGISKIGKDAVPALSKALNNPNLKIKLSATRTLGRVGPPALPAVQQLTALTRSPSPEIVQAAAKAIQQIKK